MDIFILLAPDIYWICAQNKCVICKTNKYLLQPFIFLLTVQVRPLRVKSKRYQKIQLLWFWTGIKWYKMEREKTMFAH